MFDKIFKAIVNFFTPQAPSDCGKDKEVINATAEKVVEFTVVNEVKPSVNSQITDSVTQVAITKPKRAKTAKGKFKADDKSTPGVNEAWEGGRAPAKKPRTSRKKKPTSEA